MTNEKAIEVIRAECYVANPLDIDRSILVNTALDTAIKALSQDPCEDVVSRQAVLEAIHEAYMNAYDEQSLVRDLTQTVNELPPVNPQEPKTGHWIEYTRVLIPEPINKWEQAWKCSECGYGEQDCEDGSAWIEWKFCPSCGAKMIEPQESEEQTE